MDNKAIFYNELFNQFDLLIEDVKNNLYSKTCNNMNITNEKRKLVYCKNKINEASNILLSLDSFQESISISKRKELISQCTKRYLKLDEVKSALNFYHDKIKQQFLTEDEYKFGSLSKNESKKSKYLNLEEKDDNDLTEHLLLEETKKNLEITAKNMDEIQYGMNKQTVVLNNLNENLYMSEKYVKHSKKAITIISNKRFYTKLILHIAVILLFVGIICGVIIKFEYRKGSSSKERHEDSSNNNIDSKLDLRLLNNQNLNFLEDKNLDSLVNTINTKNTSY